MSLYVLCPKFYERKVENCWYWSVLVGRSGRSENCRNHFKLSLLSFLSKFYPNWMKYTEVKNCRYRSVKNQLYSWKRLIYLIVKMRTTTTTTPIPLELWQKWHDKLYFGFKWGMNSLFLSLMRLLTIWIEVVLQKSKSSQPRQFLCLPPKHETKSAFNKQ